MIKAIRAENIYNFIQTIPTITGLATFFSMKPDQKAIPTWNYVFISIVSDTQRSKTQEWYIMKTARVSFTIVCKEKLNATDTPERILRSIIDTLTNEIVWQWCGSKRIVDWLVVMSILEDTVSPIFVSENRHYITKDYLFNYISAA